MGKYNITRSEMWSDDEVKLLSPAGKLLYNYILSSPVSNLAGYYKLEIVQIKTNLCRFDKKVGRFNEDDEVFFEKEILPQLLGQKKLWKYDEDSEQVLIPNYLKYNKVGGSKQLTAVNDVLRTMKICRLHIDFFRSLIAFSGEEALDYIPKDVRDGVIKAFQDDEYSQDIINILLSPLY